MSNEETPDDADDGRIGRREAIRKAAFGAGIAGAAWVAPRIEGLSLVPDYAAAGTAKGTFTNITRGYVSCPGSDDSWGNCGGSFGPTGNLSYNVGGETVLVTWQGRADTYGTGTAVVNFNNMDPPFNSNCKANAIGGSTRGQVCTGNMHLVNANHAGGVSNVQFDIYDNVVGNGNTCQGGNIVITVVC